MEMYCHIEQFISMSLYCGYFMYYIHGYYAFLIVNKAFVWILIKFHLL